jgi:hypothetical protein
MSPIVVVNVKCLLGQPLESLEIRQALGHGAPEILAKQGPIDVLLVGFDHRVRFWPLVVHGVSVPSRHAIRRDRAARGAEASSSRARGIGRRGGRGARAGREVEMIRGMHAMFYSSDAAALRAFFRDKLGFSGTDVGEGWLIFDVPEADLGVHPTEGGEPASGTADISFYCDDIEATVRELRARGVEFTGPIEDHGYGLVTHLRVPGAFEVQLYQPRYTK